MQFWNAIKSSSGHLPPANHTTVSRCRHSDGEVASLVQITHLLPLSLIPALLRAFYTMRYIGDVKGWLYFWEVLRGFTI